MKKNLQSLLFSSAVLAVTVTGLSGCAPLIVGGAMMTGVVATDRRTAGAQVEDDWLRTYGSRVSGGVGVLQPFCT